MATSEDVAQDEAPVRATASRENIRTNAFGTPLDHALYSTPAFSTNPMPYNNYLGCETKRFS